MINKLHTKMTYIELRLDYILEVTQN